eukprot:942826-Pyramimonas_sp.AAC.1
MAVGALPASGGGGGGDVGLARARAHRATQRKRMISASWGPLGKARGALGASSKAFRVGFGQSWTSWTDHSVIRGFLGPS